MSALRWPLWLAAIALLGSACRINPSCFRDDECATTAQCIERICVVRDAGPVSPDGGGSDAEVPDAGPEPDGGLTPDTGPEPDSGSTPDAGPILDGGPTNDGGMECTPQPGLPLDDDQAAFDDVLLMHFDEVPAAALGLNAATGDTFSLVTSPAPEPGVCGAYNNAYHFDETPLIYEAQFSRERLAYYSFEAWVRPTKTKKGCILQTYSTDQLVEFTLCLDEQLRPFVDIPNPVYGTPLALNQWTHLALLRTDDELRVATILQDGVITSTRSMTDARRFDATQVVIGGQLFAKSEWNFEGDIDEVRLSLRALQLDDLSANRPETLMVWERDGAIWLANENGFGAREVIPDGRKPRLAPNLSSILYTHCSPPPAASVCDVSSYDVGSAISTQRTIRGTIDPDVPTAFDSTGDYFYFVETRPSCGADIYRSLTNSPDPTQAELMYAVSGRNIVALDASAYLFYDREMLLFTTQGCTTLSNTQLELLVDPGLGGAMHRVVLTSETASVTYDWVRIDHNRPENTFLLEVQDRSIPQRISYRVVLGTAVLEWDRKPLSIRDNARFPTPTRRDGWALVTTPGPRNNSGEELMLWDWPTGLDAQRYLTDTSTGTSNTRADIRILWP